MNTLKRRLNLILKSTLLLLTGGVAFAQTPTVQTVVGTGGYLDSTVLTSQLISPTCAAVQPGTEDVYFADGNCLRKVSGGKVTTVAGLPFTSGTVDSVGQFARFGTIQGLQFDKTGDTLYISDRVTNFDDRFRMFLPKFNRVVSLVGASGGNPGTINSANGKTARLGGVAQFSIYNRYAYLVQNENPGAIRRISLNPPYETMSLDTGGFTLNNTSLLRISRMQGITVVSDSILFISNDDDKIIRVNYVLGTASVFAGSTQGFRNDTLLKAQFRDPKGIRFNANDTSLLIVDDGNHSIRKLSLVSGIVSTIAGNSSNGYVDAKGTSARFSNPKDIAFGNKYAIIVDQGNRRLRMGDSSVTITTFAGSGSRIESPVALHARLNSPNYICLAPDGSIYFTQNVNAVYKYSVSGGVEVFSGLPGTNGTTNGIASVVRYRDPRGTLVLGDSLYVADNGDDKIRRVSLTTGESATYVTMSSNGNPQILIPYTDSVMFVLSSTNQIFKVNRLNRTSSLFAGNGKTGFVNGFVSDTGIRFNSLRGGFVYNDTLFVADGRSNSFYGVRFIVLKGDSAGKVGTYLSQSNTIPSLAGTYPFRDHDNIVLGPNGLMYLSNVNTTNNGKGMYVFDLKSRKKVYASPSTSTGFVDGPIASARFGGQVFIQVTPGGDSLYVQDGNRIRLISGLKSVVTSEENAIFSSGSASLVFAPNPASSSFEVKSEGFASLVMYDLSGKAVLSSTSSTVSLNGVNAGLYLVKVTFRHGQSATGRLVVQ